MEEQQRQIKKRWKILWLVVGIILFVSYFTLLSVIIYLGWGQEQRYYLDGFNGTSDGLARVFYSFFVLLGILPIFILSFIYVCFLKSMFGSLPRIRRIKIVFIMILILLNPIFIIHVFGALHEYRKFTEGYRDWAKSVLDIQEIREWMTEFEEGITRIGSEDFQGPKCLADNYDRLRHGMLREDEEGGRILRIMSGGGMQDWGIVIGPEDMEVPEDEVVKYDKYQGEYRLKLTDGAYVYYELQ